MKRARFPQAPSFSRPGQLLTWAVVAGMLLAASGAAAQAPSSSTARARELFLEGVALSAEGQWARASARFEAALQLHRAPTIEYNLASAHFELGRYGLAGDLVDAVLSNPTATGQVKDHSRELQQQLARRAGQLQIMLPKTDGGKALQVRIDGRELPRERLRGPRYETPGDHIVQLTREDGTAEHRRVDVRAGHLATVVFDDPNASNPSDGCQVWCDWRTWLVVGGAVALTAVLTAVIVSSGDDGGNAGEESAGAALRF